MKKIIAVVGVIIFIWGCTKEKTVEVEKPVPVNAWCTAFLYVWPWQYATLTSDPVEEPSKCDAILKWDVNQKTFEIKERRPEGVYFNDTTTFCTPGKQYTVEITSQTFGKSSGSITIPESTMITEPDYGDTLPIGDVQITWTQSQNANFYALYADIYAFDSSGAWIFWQEIDTFLTTLSFTIPSSYFQVPGAAYYEVEVYVFPYSGGLYEANMSGDFKGYLYGEGESDYVWFYVGTPILSPASRPPHKRPTVEQRIQKIRRIIEQIAEEE